MSFDIYIGKAVIRSRDDGELVVRVEENELPDAPSFPGDEMTGISNGRHPGYAGWDLFLVDAGLKDLFFDEESGLMREHPGTFKLEEKHLQTVREAKTRWQEKHPNAHPGWCICPRKECMPWMSRDVPHQEFDGTLARLIWLEWWMDWALKNCNHPAIHNH